MPIQLLDTSITGLGSGGLPAGIITASNLASTGRLTMDCTYRNSSHGLGGDSGWQDHLSMSFTAGVAQRCMVMFFVSIGYEAGAVRGFFRILMDGSMIGYHWAGGRQHAANCSAAGSGWWYADVSAGSHTIMIQARNSIGGTTWYTPYWNDAGEGSNTLGVLYYA